MFTLCIQHMWTFGAKSATAHTLHSHNRYFFCSDTVGVSEIPTPCQMSGNRMIKKNGITYFRSLTALRTALWKTKCWVFIGRAVGPNYSANEEWCWGAILGSEWPRAIAYTTRRPHPLYLVNEETSGRMWGYFEVSIPPTPIGKPG